MEFFTHTNLNNITFANTWHIGWGGVEVLETLWLDKSRCKLTENRFLIPHDTKLSTVGKHKYQIIMDMID